MVCDLLGLVLGECASLVVMHVWITPNASMFERSPAAQCCQFLVEYGGLDSVVNLTLRQETSIREYALISLVNMAMQGTVASCCCPVFLCGVCRHVHRQCFSECMQRCMLILTNGIEKDIIHSPVGALTIFLVFFLACVAKD